MFRKTQITAVILWFVLAPSLSAEVKNRDKPEKGVWDFNPRRIWQVEEVGQDVFGHPFTLRVSEESTLYVFDMKNNVNYIFDSAGNFKREFAKGGEGPGEIIGQGRTFLSEEKVIIAGMNGIHFFSKDGDYLQTKKQEGSRLPLHLSLNEDEFVAAPLTGIHTPEGKGKILVQNLKLGTENVLAEFTSFSGGVGQSGGQVFDMIVIGLSPMLTIGHSEDRIYWGESENYLINITDLKGKGIDSFSVNRKPTRFPKREKKKYFARGDLPPAALNQIINSFPDALTHFHRIEYHNGFVYVFVPELDLDANRGKIRQIDIFSPEGKYLYRAEIELEKGLRPFFSPLDNLVIQGSHMYTACELEDDTVVIVKFRIDLPTY